MFKYTNRELSSLAEECSFVKNTVEKVLRLMDILDYIAESDISAMLALKGGTAINLCLLELPRLSVDVDMDFSLDCSKEETLEKRTLIKTLITGYMLDQGYSLSDRSRFTYTLDSFVFSYMTLSGSRDVLKIEINYSDRVHIMQTVSDTSISVGGRSCKVHRLADEELIGSKINALIVRTTPRDVYDVYRLFHAYHEKDFQLIKKIAIFYATIGSDKPVYFEDLCAIAFKRMRSFNYNKIRATLIPVLHKGERIVIEDICAEVILELEKMFILDENEKEFVAQYNAGIYLPSLLFKGIDVNDVSNHPMALWKAGK